ncbi:hypothetical protein AJ80_09143 [Polytolypa hystricis UAMH7299]|uniref:Uncharacterized protein n=1 Tax=Polytolypa hystricis (strain UAMH7299) TaxID=1447883 RepID=A0A2B7WVP0_POLH7|nr:hypothetical protein AJ80_09143 [Polytolypa hystricis UAMH7299]
MPIFSSRILSLIFPIVSIFGVYIVSNLFLNTGHYQFFQELQNGSEPFIFPDGTTLQTFYTGITPLDQYLTNLQLIFASVIDGSNLELSLLGLHFGGIMFALFAVMLVEALRSGRKRDMAVFALFGLAIQYCGYFVTMPLYCYVRLLATQRDSNQASPAAFAKVPDSAIRIIPFSLIVGYVVPSIIMCWPSLPGQSRQFAVAFWQNFPLWTCLVQASAQKICDNAVSSKSQDSAHRLAATRSAVSQTYTISLIIYTAIHIAASLPIIAASLSPDMLFSASTGAALHWKRFLIPPMWTSTVQISGIADGAGNFLRYDYYIGTLAALIWAAVSFCDIQMTITHEKHSVMKDILKVVMWGVVGGPGAALLIMMSIREDFRFSVIETSKMSH